MGAPHAIVPEFLTEENFGRWKIWMKNYLLGKELWDIVEGTEPKPDQAAQVAEFRTWRKKNGKALYAIQVSCGPGIFDIISEMDSAKASWDAILDFMVEPTSTEKHTEIPSLPGKGEVSRGGEISDIVSEIDSAEAFMVQPSSTEKHTEITGRSNDDNTWRIQLHEAVVKGDWKKTESLINSHPEALSARLSMGETILHTAVLNNHVHLVVELVKKMSTEDTEITLPYRRNSTALHLAAVRGIVKIAEVLVKKNVNLLRLGDNLGFLPVNRASLTGNKVMMRYLYSVTPEEVLINLNQIKEGTNLLNETIDAGEYDFALEIHGHHPQLTFAQNINGVTPLTVLAGKPSAFPSGNQLKFWQRWIYNCINVQQSRTSNNCSEDSVQTKVSNRLKELSWDVAKIFAPGIEQIYNTKLNNMRAHKLLTSMSRQVSTLNASEIKERKVVDAMMVASEFGIVEFVVEMVKSNPTLLWMSATRGIFRIAVRHRQERIWNLIYGLGAEGVEFSTFTGSSDGNSWLHEAGNLAPSSRLSNVSGPAMQMQWEQQWFKEVETIVSPLLRARKNKAGKTARTLFTEQHKDLVKEAEKWMKDTASSCMVVTTLIATVMFAAAFTVPGGNDSQKGIPIFLPQMSFMVFIVADALSLFSSTASILMFLSILTSRYAEEDFLKSLPKRLIIGFATLFFSIATMMVAFSTTLVIVLHDRYKWVAIPIFSLAGVPVILFALLQLPLFVDMVLATYGSRIFRTQTKLLINSVHTQSTQTQYLDP